MSLAKDIPQITEGVITEGVKAALAKPIPQITKGMKSINIVPDGADCLVVSASFPGYVASAGSSAGGSVFTRLLCEELNENHNR